MKYDVIIGEAIQDALTFIEKKNGHRGGDLYRELAATLEELRARNVDEVRFKIED